MVRLQAPEGGERASPRDGGSALWRPASVAAGGPPAARRPVEPAPPPPTPLCASRSSPRWWPASTWRP